MNALARLLVGVLEVIDRWLLALARIDSWRWL